MGQFDLKDIGTAIVTAATLGIIGWAFLTDKKPSAGSSTPQNWDAESLIRRYGLLLEKVAGAGLVDAGRLPVPKQKLREILLQQVRAAPDSTTRSVLCAGYLELHRFQPGLASARAAARPATQQTGDPALNRMLAAAAKIVADQDPPELAEAARAELGALRRDIAGYM